VCSDLNVLVDADEAAGLSERLAAGLDPNLIYEDGDPPPLVLPPRVAKRW